MVKMAPFTTQGGQQGIRRAVTDTPFTAASTYPPTLEKYLSLFLSGDPLGHYEPKGPRNALQ